MLYYDINNSNINNDYHLWSSFYKQNPILGIVHYFYFSQQPSPFSKTGLIIIFILQTRNGGLSYVRHLASPEPQILTEPFVYCPVVPSFPSFQLENKVSV